MKKIHFAAIAAALLIAPQAWAQASHFTGWSLGLKLDSATTWTEFIGGGTSAKISDASQNASLQAAYSAALANHGVLGFGVTYSFGDLKAGSIDVGGRSVDFKLKNMYSVYVEPGYVLNDSWLAYAKLGYYGVRNGEESVDGVTASKTFGGLGYGVGMRTMLDKKLYLQIEFTQADYNRKTPDFGAYRSMTSTGSIGLGFKF